MIATLIVYGLAENITNSTPQVQPKLTKFKTRVLKLIRELVGE
jgi:hypothetical protein